MTRQRPLSDALSCVLRWAAGQTDTAKERPTRRRASRTLIILIDGTLSTLQEGREHMLVGYTSSCGKAR
ncbi:MAG: hypothetical protein L7V34_04305 [Rhodobacteraceae bacterium]|nr:hypothetical protein [Paracoccaceae bacterium]